MISKDFTKKVNGNIYYFFIPKLSSNIRILFLNESSVKCPQGESLLHLSPYFQAKISVIIQTAFATTGMIHAQAA